MTEHTDIDQDEIRERMKNHWNDANDFLVDLDKVDEVHLALPEANAIADHTEVLLDEQVLRGVALSAVVGHQRAHEVFKQNQREILTMLFVTGYNMGRAGEELQKVVANCDHNKTKGVSN